jgi:hypothetical protein
MATLKVSFENCRFRGLGKDFVVHNERLNGADAGRWPAAIPKKSNYKRVIMTSDHQMEACILTCVRAISSSSPLPALNLEISILNSVAQALHCSRALRDDEYTHASMKKGVRFD